MRQEKYLPMLLVSARRGKTGEYLREPVSFNPDWTKSRKDLKIIERNIGNNLLSKFYIYLFHCYDTLCSVLVDLSISCVLSDFKHHSFYDAVNFRFVESRLHNYCLRCAARTHVLDDSYVASACRLDPTLLYAMLSISRLLIVSAATHLAQRNRWCNGCVALIFRSFNARGVWRYNIEVDDYRYSYSLRNEMSTITDPQCVRRPDTK